MKFTRKELEEKIPALFPILNQDWFTQNFAFNVRIVTVEREEEVHILMKPLNYDARIDCILFNETKKICQFEGLWWNEQLKAYKMRVTFH